MLDDDCITRILDMLWSIKGAKYVNEFANIAPLDYHVLYFKDKAIADACDYFNVPDTILWDRLQALKKFPEICDIYENVFMRYFNMKAIHLMERRLMERFEINHRNKNPMHRNLAHFIQFTHSHKNCIVCRTLLPYDWISHTKYGNITYTCSRYCHKVVIRKYRGCFVLCKYRGCKSRIGLDEIDHIDGYHICTTCKDIRKRHLLNSF